MRRRVLAATPLLLLTIAGWSGRAADKQYPIFTPENLVSTMKLVGRNFAAVNAAISKSDFETAKAQLARSRELLAVTSTFWRDRHKDDARQILKDALTKMDQLDDALSAEKIDGAQAAAVAKQVGAACQACHAVYREQDPKTRAFRLKAGSVE